MSKINRRQLGRRLAGGLALGLLNSRASAGADAFQQLPAGADRSAWVPVHPGVWKATVGTPETITPVKSRLVPPLVEALMGLPQVGSAAIRAPISKASRRGIMLELPLAAHEEIYGFGLQFFSTAQRGKKRVIRVNAEWAGAGCG